MRSWPNARPRSPERVVRAVVALWCVVAVLAGCSRQGPPNSLFDSVGYHVRDGKVYYLKAFPGKAFEIEGADTASFQALDTTYARDNSSVYADGRTLPGADPASFELIQRPGFAKDSRHVYQRDRPISDDPAHFELLDAGLAKDSVAVYWSDGTVLSNDPAHVAIVSNTGHYLFAKDGRTVYVNGKPISGADPASFRVLQGAYSTADQRVFYFTDELAADLASFGALAGPYATDARTVYWMGKAIVGADPATFHVLNADFECSADEKNAYYRQSIIAGADPRSFPAGRAVTGCTETSISFAQ